jgi:hypothetical protein
MQSIQSAEKYKAGIQPRPEVATPAATTRGRHEKEQLTAQSINIGP